MKKRNGSREALREVLEAAANGVRRMRSRDDRLDTVSICPSADCRSALDEVVFQGACRMLQVALETEVDEFLERHDYLRDARACR
jgi:hypothetical protein